MMSVPVMSEGIRSGVNWMRRKESPSVSAIVRTISVLAVPGKPVIRQCPPTNNAMRIWSSTSSCPTMTCRTWVRMPSRTAWNLSMRCCSWAASWLSSGSVTIGNVLPLNYAVFRKVRNPLKFVESLISRKNERDTRISCTRRQSVHCCDRVRPSGRTYSQTTKRPLGPEGRFLDRKRRPQGLKPTVLVSVMYGLKPVPFIHRVFPQPIKPCPSSKVVFHTMVCTLPFSLS